MKRFGIVHEMNQMIAMNDEGKIKLSPIKLKKYALELPSQIQSRHYLRLYEYDTILQLVKRILEIHPTSN